jgi:hypothetical protein
MIEKSRVTFWANFCILDYFLFAMESFLKIIEVVQMFGLLLSTARKLDIIFDKKLGCASFWEDFVTNASGHPGRQDVKTFF